MTPRIFQNFTLQLQQCTLDIEKNEDRKRELSPVRHQTCSVPSQNHEPSREMLRFVRVCVQTFVKRANFCTTPSWWHDITSSKVSCFPDNFVLELKCHGTPCMCPCRDTICLKIPSSLLHMELTRTQVHKYDFFKLLWLAIA